MPWFKGEITPGSWLKSLDLSNLRHILRINSETIWFLMEASMDTSIQIGIFVKFISTPPSNYAFALENCIYIGYTYVMCFFRSSELGSANGMNFYQGTSDCCREAFTPISRLKSAYILLILATSLSSVYPQPLEDRWHNTFRFR